MHREDLAIDFRPCEGALRSGELGTDQHGEHAADAEEHGSSDDEPLAEISVANAAEYTAPPGLVFPDAGQVAVEFKRLHRAAPIKLFAFSAS